MNTAISILERLYVACLFSFVRCVFCFVCLFVLCLVYPMLSMPLDCSFFITTLVFFNVYFCKYKHNT